MIEWLEWGAGITQRDYNWQGNLSQFELLLRTNWTSTINIEGENYSTAVETCYWCIRIIMFWNFTILKCGLCCSPIWSVVFYCLRIMVFNELFQKFLTQSFFVISKVCCELSLMYLPVLFWVTFFGYLSFSWGTRYIYMVRYFVCVFRRRW